MAGTGDSIAELALNGVDADTGDYLGAGVTRHTIAEMVRGLSATATVDRALRARHRRAAESRLAPRHGVDVGDLAQAGWGVVFPVDADPAIHSALRPLLDLRHDQAAARDERRFREFVGPDGWNRGESKQSFMRRHHCGPGPVDPDVMPYYLLLVGSPDEIPFPVQRQLAAQHAVGRLDLDGVEAYARYAENLVAAESAADPARPPRLTVFAPRNDGDIPTALSADQLAAPLADAFASGTDDAWQVMRFLGEGASKEALAADLFGTRQPDILVAAAHGVRFPNGDVRQRRTQGALLCQNWPGPGSGRLSPAHWFGPDDVAAAAAADLSGLVALLFACYGAGTPAVDEFHLGPGSPRPLAPEPFVAALPRALLSRPGGALAIIGHVDQVWSYSYLWPGVGRQTEVFRSTLARLGAGHTVGSAVDYLTDRAAELAFDLDAALDEVRLGKRVDDDRLAELWTAARDARSYILLGDPAVRAVPRPGPELRVAAGSRRRRVATPTPAIARDSRPVEIDTYVTDRPADVGYDPQSGRLTGATLYLASRVRPDGGGSHLVSTSATAMVPDDADRRTAIELHARMVEIGLAARRTSGAAERGDER